MVLAQWLCGKSLPKCHKLQTNRIPMATRFVRSVSVLVVSAVAGLNGGFSSTTDHAALSEGAQSIGKAEWGGTLAFSSYLPSLSITSSFVFPGACAREDGSSIRQVSFLSSHIWSMIHAQ